MAKKDRLPEPSVYIRDVDRATATAKIQVDKNFATAVTRRMAPYRHLPRTFRPALEKIGDYVRTEMIPRTFKQEGPGWAPLARRTVAERLEKGYAGSHPILIRTRDLFKELTQKSHPKHIEIIKTGKHARIEIGGSSAKFIENQMGDREQRLPARPMIPGTGKLRIPDRDRIAMRNILIRAIRKRV